MNPNNAKCSLPLHMALHIGEWVFMYGLWLCLSVFVCIIMFTVLNLADQQYPVIIVINMVKTNI